MKSDKVVLNGYQHTLPSVIGLLLGLSEQELIYFKGKPICNAGYACNCEKIHIVNCKHGHNSDRLDKREQESFGHDIASGQYIVC